MPPGLPDKVFQDRKGGLPSSGAEGKLQARCNLQSILPSDLPNNYLDLADSAVVSIDIAMILDSRKRGGGFGYINQPMQESDNFGRKERQGLDLKRRLMQTWRECDQAGVAGGERGKREERAGGGLGDRASRRGEEFLH